MNNKLKSMIFALIIIFSSNSYAQSDASEKPFSFLFIGDTSQNYSAEALKFVYETYADLKMIFYTYDLRNPAESTYKNLQSEWKRNPHADEPTVPVFFIMGNHDIANAAAVNYQVKTLGPLLATSLPGMKNFKEGPYDSYPQHDNFEDRYLQYSFEFGNSLFIVLNNYYHDIVLGLDRFNKGYAPQGCMNEDQLAWLESLLKNTTAEHKFLFMHEPAYPPPGTKHAGDSMDNFNCPGNSNDNPGINSVRPMRERFWALLAKYQATAAFSGHNHNDAQTWVGYPYELPGNKAKAQVPAPVYDISGGELGLIRKITVVQVTQTTVTISQYEAQRDAPGISGYKKKLDNIIIDRSPTQPNYTPKILQFKGGENYQPTERNNVKFEAGMDIGGQDALFFEARDNNVQDTINFKVDKAPSFLIARNEGGQFRRITFTTLPKYKLGVADVGDHLLTLQASDGRAEDKMALTISVLPAEKPKVLGSVIPNGSKFRKVGRVDFICHDNVRLHGWNPPAPTVKRNGLDVPLGKQSWWREFKNEPIPGIPLGLKSAVLGKDLQTLPGSYEVTGVCTDAAGNSSAPYMVTFSIVDDGLPTEQTSPWVVGTYPPSGTTVKSLNRISIWIDTLVGTNRNLVINTSSKISLAKDGVPFGNYIITKNLPQGTAPRMGDIDLIFNSPLEKGLYELKVTPVATKSIKNYVSGETRIYTFTVVQDTIGKNQFMTTATASSEGIISDASTILSPRLQSKEIFVDKTPTKDCPGNYSLTDRTCSSSATGILSYISIQKASDTAKAGDTVLIRGGVYKEMIRPANSGVAGKPITYKNYGAESVVITDAQLRNIPTGEYSDFEWDRYGIYLWDKSYIIIEGLHFSDLYSGWARIVKSHHITLKNNTFTKALSRGDRASIKFLDSHDNKILSNVIEDGHDNLMLLKSDRNLVAGNTFRKGRHVLWAIKCGNFNVVRDNYFHNDIQKIGEIYDCNDPNSEDFKHFGIKLVDSAKHNLVENNVFAFTKDAPGLAKFNGIQYAGQNGIIRNNVFYDNLGGGLGMTVYDKEAEYNYGNRIYNNVFYNNHHGGIIYTYFSGGGAPCWSDNIHKNNIFYNNFDMAQIHLSAWKAACLGGFSFENNNILKDVAEQDTIYYTGASPTAIKEKGPLSYWQKKHPRFFTNNDELEPEFADVQKHDFHLKENSPMIDKGAFLTQTIAPGSGTSLQVEDARYFYDGYEIETEKGDLIQLQGQTQTARVIAIDYNNNILTLDRSLIWDSKKGVGLRFNGQSPDLGAHEYR